MAEFREKISPKRRNTFDSLLPERKRALAMIDLMSDAERKFITKMLEKDNRYLLGAHDLGGDLRAYNFLMN